MTDQQAAESPEVARARPFGRHRTLLGVGVATLAVAVAVAACGGGSNGKDTGGAGPAPSGGSSGATNRQGGGNAGPGAGGNGSAAFGTIAALEDSSFEVQNTTVGQVTVSYTGTTRFSETVAAKAADITVGSCILAVTAMGSGSSATPAATSGTASSVTITPATNGSCALGAGFGAPGAGGFGAGGFGGGGFTGTRPTNRPSGAPTFRRPSGSRSFSGGPGGTGGFGGGGAGFGGIVSGKVTAVAGDSISVASVVRAGRPTSSSAPSSPTGTPTTTQRTVTISSTTMIHKVASVTSSALKVGLCATANGKTDTTGAVAATAVSLSTPAAGGSCESGFGGGFGGRRGGGGSGPTAGSS